MSGLDSHGKHLQGSELEQYATKRGLCHICGETQTHELKGRLLNRRREPRELVRDRNGDILVYKGYCLRPTCYTLQDAKRALGEKSERRTRHRVDRARQVVDAEVSYSTSSAASPPLAPQLANPIIPSISPSSNQLPVSEPIHLSQSGIRPVVPHLENPQTVLGLLAGEIRQGDRDEPIDRGGDEGNELLACINENSLISATIASGSDGSGSAGIFNPGSSTSSHASLHSSLPSSGLSRSSAEAKETLTPTDRILQQMEEAVQFGDFTEFMTLLGANGTRREVAKHGFQLLCKGVREEHKKDKRMSSVFVNDCWVKSINTVINDHFNDEEVQELGAATYAVLSHISTRYMFDIIKHGGVKILLKILDTYIGSPGTVDNCCCALFCMIDRTARNDQPIPALTGHLLLHELGGKTVECLVSAVGAASTVGKCWALNAIINLGLQGFKAANGKTFSELVRDACHGQGIDRLIDSINADTSHAGLGQSGLELLALLSTRDSEDDSMVMTEKLWRTVISIISCAKDEQLHRSAHQILNNMKISPDLATIEALVSFVESATELLNDSIAMPGLQKAVIVSVIGVLRSSKQQKVLSCCDPLVVAIISTMKAYVSDLEMQSISCLALAVLASENDGCKSCIVNNEGVQCIATALNLHVLNAPSREEMHEELRLHACTVFLSLASSSLTSLALRDQQYTARFWEAAHTGAGLLPVQVRTGIIDVLSGGSDLKGPNYAASVRSAIESLMRASTKAETETWMTIVSSMCNRSSRALDALLVTQNDQGIDCISRFMSRYTESLLIQQAGCDILAEVFVKYPFRGRFGLRTRLEARTAAFYVVPHNEEQVIVIRKALDVFKTEVSLIQKAFTALGFYLHGLVSANISSEEIDDRVRQSFLGMLKVSLDALSIHQDASEVQTSALVMIQHLLLICEKSEIRRWSPFLIEKSMMSLEIHIENTDVKICVCSTLLSIIHEGEDHALGVINGHRFVKLMLNCLQSDSVDAAEIASELVATILPRAISLVAVLVEFERSIDIIVGTMLRQSDSAAITGHCCSILVSLSTLHDSYVLPMIVDSGGVQALLGAMNKQQNCELQDVACQALLNVSRGISDDALAGMKIDLAKTTIWALQQNMMHTGILASLLELFWNLCARDDYFREFYTANDAILAVVQAMNEHVFDRSVQAGGCTTLWGLTSFGDNKQIIGEIGGLRSILNAMLAHLESIRIQKEGLTALKNLATTSRNKQLIISADGIKTILICMRSGMKNVGVLSAAFSALNNIAVDTALRVVTDVPREIFEFVIFAMRRYATSEDLQKSACFMLKSFTFSSNNLDIMRRLAGELVPLLTLAAESFPEECGDRAHYIIGDLL